MNMYDFLKRAISREVDLSRVSLKLYLKGALLDIPTIRVIGMYEGSDTISISYKETGKVDAKAVTWVIRPDHSNYITKVAFGRMTSGIWVTTLEVNLE